MVRIDVGKYADKLKNINDINEEKEMDLYSLKKELNDLNDASGVFDSFEKESMTVGRGSLEQVQDLSLLLKIKNLATQIKNKNHINGKLHSLHFSLNLLKNAESASSVKNALNILLYDNETKVDALINELNDFKTKLEEIKKHHSKLLPKSLDNKLELEEKYGRHIEQLDLVHKMQKNALISILRLFLKLTKGRIKSLKRFKNNK